LHLLLLQTLDFALICIQLRILVASKSAQVI